MQAKKPYHKENLRRDLLDAGREYVRQNGHGGLSIRMLAQQVGVSPGAPYHHFPDRRSFLLALAIDQFETLLKEQFDVQPEGLTPAQWVKARASKFVRFALENPHMLELMYDSDLTQPQVDPELQRYYELSHQSGTDAIRRCLPSISEKEAGMRNIALWASIYGLVTMINRGVIRPFGGGTYTLDEICERVVEQAARASVSIEG